MVQSEHCPGSRPEYHPGPTSGDSKLQATPAPEGSKPPFWLSWALYSIKNKNIIPKKRDPVSNKVFVKG